MDLWIRTQDKMNLVKVNQININYKNTCQIIANYIPDFIGKEGEYYETLGNYNSEERALEVLDEIQNILRPTLLLNGCSIDDETLKDLKLPKNAITMTTHDNATITYSGSYVYEMPQE